MAGRIDARLQELGIELPQPAVPGRQLRRLRAWVVSRFEVWRAGITKRTRLSVNRPKAVTVLVRPKRGLQAGGAKYERGSVLVFAPPPDFLQDPSR